MSRTPDPSRNGDHRADPAPDEHTWVPARPGGDDGDVPLFDFGPDFPTGGDVQPPRPAPAPPARTRGGTTGPGRGGEGLDAEGHDGPNRGPSADPLPDGGFEGTPFDELGPDDDATSDADRHDPPPPGTGPATPPGAISAPDDFTLDVLADVAPTADPGSFDSPPPSVSGDSPRPRTAAEKGAPTGGEADGSAPPPPSHVPALRPRRLTPLAPDRRGAASTPASGPSSDTGTDDDPGSLAPRAGSSRVMSGAESPDELSIPGGDWHIPPIGVPPALPGREAARRSAGWPAGAGATLGLPEVCEPLFQLVCRLNRMKRSGQAAASFEPGAVRAEVERVFGEVSAAALVAGRAADLEEIAGALRHFVDIILTRGGFPWAAEWRPLASGRGADDAVLDAVAGALADDGPFARERLEVLHACLCFCSDLLSPAAGRPSPAELLEEAAARLVPPAPHQAVVCPSAYGGVFTRAILPGVARRLRITVAVSLGLLLFAIAAVIVLNVSYSRSLRHSVQRVGAALDRETEAAARVNGR